VSVGLVVVWIVVQVGRGFRWCLKRW